MTVDDVIRRLHSEGDVGKAWFHVHRDPRPLEREPLARLRLDDGSAPPEELTTWLAYDAAWFPLLDPSAPQDAPRLALRPLREILGRWAGAPEDGPGDAAEQLLAAWIDLLPESDLVDAVALELPRSGSQEHLLVLRPGRELRVLGCHQGYEFWWKYDGFAQFLAHYFGYEARE
ncbi:hypothetical protein [Nannocystis punicea]|uniref:Uncharacterized protein n=1 Tax=Nannocystis punicea TaxID=2995304 RepID=A0ABY7GXQ9_9BACT|nr:hypothetical protein [Nannocystis poenicansa]WAS91761.1 hypothetical protein O0S08_36730 [Nannocystis poenicansa]